MSFFDGRFFWRRAGGVWVEGELSMGGFLLLLLGGRFELLLAGFEDSSVCFEDDPVVDIAGPSTALPRRRVVRGGGDITSCPAGWWGEVSTFCLLLRRLAEGGLDSVDGSVWPESR